MNTTTQADTTVTEAIVKASPPLGVGGLTLFGVPVNSILVVLTIIYTVFQLYFLLRDKWWRQRPGYQSKGNTHGE